jgi:hypothetical protein
MTKQIADTTYSLTNKNSNFLEPLKPKTGYIISTEDSKTLTNVIKRFTEMKSARTRIDIDWQIWQQIAESKFYPYKD